MSNAGYGNYVEDTPAPASSDKAPTKPGDGADGAKDGSAKSEAPAAATDEASPEPRPQGGEVDPGEG